MELNSENILENILLSIDGELNAEQQKLLNKYLQHNKTAQELYDKHTIVKAKLLSENKVVNFPNKLDLLAIANTEVIPHVTSNLQVGNKRNWLQIAAAIALLVALGGILKLNFNTNHLQLMANKEIATVKATVLDSGVNVTPSVIAPLPNNIVPSNNMVTELPTPNKEVVEKLVSIEKKASNNKPTVIFNNCIRNIEVEEAMTTNNSTTDLLQQLPTASLVNIAMPAIDEIATKPMATIINNYDRIKILESQKVNNYIVMSQKMQEGDETEFANNKLINKIMKLKNNWPHIKEEAKSFRENGLIIEVAYVGLQGNAKNNNKLN